MRRRGPSWSNCLDSQLGELLAELPGVSSDPADGVVAEVKLLQSQQAVQPPLVHLSQVVVFQLPEGRRKGTIIRLFDICVKGEFKKRERFRARAIEVSLQDFHVAEAPEGSVHQAVQAIPLHP